MKYKVKSEYSFPIIRNDKTYTVRVIRKDVKRASIAINHHGEIVLTSSSPYTKQEVVSFLQKNATILDKLLNKVSFISLKDHEIMLFGTIYEGVCIPTFQTNYKIEGNTIYYKEIHYIYQDALKEIAKQFEAFKQVFDQHINATISFRKMKTRWGVCYIRKKKIVLTTALVHVPKDLIQYVIVHEFCHFIEANHSKNFYLEVKKYYPNYLDARKKLKQYSCFLP